MNIEEFDLECITEPLLEWFQGYARVLPWRENPAPYRVWVSEIMLQQTRVEAVKPYFERFIEALPTVNDLAVCEEDVLLKLWEGLGYYNRVRNMQSAAKQIMEQYGGKIPSAYKDLLQLKGIGHYTAGAIASIAYGQAVPAVDGNVLRVISRVAADDRDIRKQSVRSNMEVELQKIIPEQSAGAFNQALMELGATVCLPNAAPKCGQCPWTEICLAKKEEKLETIPFKSKAAGRKKEERTVFLIQDGEKILLRKRPKKGLLAGMYEFPNAKGRYTQEMALAYVKEMGFSPRRIQTLEQSVHIFSHVEWHMQGYLIRIDAFEQSTDDTVFAEVWDFKEKYAMPSAFRAYMKYLHILQGKERLKEAEW